MIRHCVMFRWADDVQESTKEAISAELDRLATLECVTRYDHGPDAGINEGNFDYVVVGDFESVEAYREYATEDGHLRMIEELIKPNIAARAAVQYSI